MLTKLGISSTVGSVSKGRAMYRINSITADICFFLGIICHKFAATLVLVSRCPLLSPRIKVQLLPIIVVIKTYHFQADGIQLMLLLQKSTGYHYRALLQVKMGAHYFQSLIVL